MNFKTMFLIYKQLYNSCLQGRGFRISGFLQKNSIIFPKSYKVLQRNQPQTAPLSHYLSQDGKIYLTGNLEEIESC